MTGETIKVVLERENGEHDDYKEAESDGTGQNEKNQIFKLEKVPRNARKVSAVRFERVNQDDVTRLGFLKS
ncbi:hypothetical protein ACH5RR_027795 [Cinchona calisaya]|uniref:Uncharacterized protein n=1 Tax=Cinchona calisaya TaxID=153742 RepID=A0ABD2YLX1_9GENT